MEAPGQLPSLPIPKSGPGVNINARGNFGHANFKVSL